LTDQPDTCDASTVNLQWSAVAGATYYNLELRNGSLTGTTNYPNKPNGFNPSPDPSVGVWNWSVQACNATCCGPWASGDDFEIKDYAPPIPDTGQTQTYTSTYGEDHDYSINTMSFTDNGLTVTDDLVGLMWEKKTSGNTADTYNHANAISYCNGLSLDGYSDWRLPTRFELRTIVNYGLSDPAIYDPFFTFTNTQSGFYWVIEEYAGDTTEAWVVDFDLGHSWNAFDKGDLYYARCVRGEICARSFAVENHSGDDVIVDADAQLMWEIKTAGNLNDWVEWEDAIAHCETTLNGSNYAGYNDWRLPTIKELESIVDITKGVPAHTIYDIFINNGGNGDYPYFSSTSFHGSAPTTGSAWVIEMDDGGYVSNHAKQNSIHRVRCVRHY